MKLKNKVVLITGAASGMGRAQIKRFAKEGAKVVAFDIDKEGLQELEEEAKELNIELLALEVDVSDSEQVEAGVKQALDQFQTIDILSNTAGVLDDFTPLLETDEDLWDQILNINLKGIYLVTKAVLPTMLEQGKAAIINIASIAGFVAGGGGAAYTSSKHAVVGLTKQISHDYGQKGVKINAIAPGYIETSMTEDVDPALAEDIPAARTAKPEEVANLAFFLASDQSDYIHGEAIKIDGGWTTS
ncbi:3-oxoacyl-ACP reductase [Amphibacillus sp. Q70]|uniref:3-oxoacyl-ACP reductase n=1 Tax=Amphibacillus sp. Q70 TaxID=3453416 RepID=UPI003F85F33F